MSTSLSPQILELKKEALCFLGMTAVMMGDIPKSDFEQIVEKVETKHGTDEEAAMSEAFLRAARKAGEMKKFERGVRKMMRENNIPLDIATAIVIGEVRGAAEVMGEALRDASTSLRETNERIERRFSDMPTL